MILSFCPQFEGYKAVGLLYPQRMVQWGFAFLRRLPPEWAHNLGMWLMGLWQYWSFRLAGRKPPTPGRVGIRVSEDLGLNFRTRVGLAAGFDKDARGFAALSTLGFGFVEVGTVTPRPQYGNPKPRLFRIGNRELVNQMGFNNCGLQQFKRNVTAYRRFLSGFPLLANIGKNKNTSDEHAHDDYQAGFETLRSCVDGFVVNLSSPNTPGLVNLQNEAFLEKLCTYAPRKAPIWIKFSPDLEDGTLRSLCEAVARLPLAGAVVGNTSRRLAEARGFDAGGLSGTGLGDRARECVAIAREGLGKKVLIGVGGIVTPEDAVEMRKLGADLVEVYTGFVYGGPRWLHRVRRALKE